MAEGAPSICTSIQKLLAAEVERDLSEPENRSIEMHIQSCPRCEATILGGDLPLPPVELPSAEEWRTVEAEIEAATGSRVGIPGVPDFGPRSRARILEIPASPRAGGRRPRRLGWPSLGPVAATVLVALWLAVWAPPSAFLPADDPVVDAEILELPTGTEAVIFALEEQEGGGLLIYLSG